MKKISAARHADGQAISHKDLRSRFGTAFLAGCLALSVCPALAFAAPGDQGAESGDQAGPTGNPPAAMQQFDASTNAVPQQGPTPDQQGNAPVDRPEEQERLSFSGQDDQTQPPSAPQDQVSDGQQGQVPGIPQGQQGQEPGNQPGADMQPRADALGDQVRQILAEKYGITLPNAGDNGAFKPGDPADAPELPEGAVNVQQVIDTARDILNEYASEDLSTKLDDAEFVAAVKAYALSATEQRLAMFASNPRPTMDAPSDLPSDEAANPSDEGRDVTSADDSIMSSIVKLIMEVFDYVAD